LEKPYVKSRAKFRTELNKTISWPKSEHFHFSPHFCNKNLLFFFFGRIFMLISRVNNFEHAKLFGEFLETSSINCNAHTNGRFASVANACFASFPLSATATAASKNFNKFRAEVGGSK